MSGRPDRRRDVADAIFADEVGIEYGVYGAFRLRSAYQPIFTPRSGTLAAVAVEGLIEPHRAGRPVAPPVFFDGIAAADRLFVETMCRMLHLRNFRNIGVEGLDLFFNYNPLINDHPGRALAEIRLMTRHLGDFDLHPGMLVCEITEQAADDKVLVSLVHEMRRNGIRIAIDDFGTGHSTEERIALLSPDIVKIDGTWFARILPPCRRRTLLPAACLDRCTIAAPRCWSKGSSNPCICGWRSMAASTCCRDIHLARPALAGTIFNEEPLSIEALLGMDNKVVPLHQRR